MKQSNLQIYKSLISITFIDSMKLVTMAVALLGVVSTTRVGSLEGNKLYTEQESMINSALKKAD